MVSRFIISTQDYSGLGFAMRLQEEGHQVTLAVNPLPRDIADGERCSRYARVGEGIVEKASLGELMSDRQALSHAYWIWDSNHSVEENETLRGERFLILGGGRHSYCMEHDRQACLEFVGRYGLESPPSFRFERPQEAISFCSEHPETAYVYKPDSGDKFETFLPESADDAEANVELRLHLQSLAENGSPHSAFLLQERKEGIETNVEVWFVSGRPVFAFMSLECKKRYVLDLGELTGCAFDYVFTIPLESRAVQDSVGKLFPAYEEMKYTGFADANFIAAKDGVWFLEKCERFGYNAHPNLFWNLAKRGAGEILASLIDGEFTSDFAEGFGASLTMSTKENSPPGKAIQFPAKLGHDLYFYDAYKRGDLWLIAGYDSEGDVLLVTGYGYTMPTAWETVLKKAGEVRFPYRYYRPDGDQTNFPTSPIRRYEALKAMGYI